MKDHFEYQILDTEPLTSESLHTMKKQMEQAWKEQMWKDDHQPIPEDDTLVPKSCFGRHYVVGDKVLRFKEKLGDKEKWNSFALVELDQLTESFEYVEKLRDAPTLRRKL